MTMPQKVLCPHCQAILSLGESPVGTVIDCAQCGQKFRVPLVREPVSLPPSIPPSPASPPVPIVPRLEPDEKFSAPAPERPLSGPPGWDPDDYAHLLPKKKTDKGLKSLERYPQEWNRVSSGIGLIQVGWLVLGVVFLVWFCSGGAFPTQRYGSYTEDYDHSPYARSSPREITALFGCGGVIGLALIILGQIFCCAVPRSSAKGMAILSLLLLLAFGGVQMCQWASTPPTRPISYEVIPSVCLLGIGGLSHLLFLFFLGDVSNTFQDRSSFPFVVLYLILGVVFGYILFFLLQSRVDPLASIASDRPFFIMAGAAVGFLLFFFWMGLLNRVRGKIREVVRTYPQ